MNTKQIEIDKENRVEQNARDEIERVEQNARDEIESDYDHEVEYDDENKDEIEGE